MMNCLSEDLKEALKDRSGHNELGIDIGVTTFPYYVGKTQSIEESDEYPSRPKHVHIIGYDTVTRFLAPKYYPDNNPPLSALTPYFGGGHKLLVALRPESSSENMKDAGSQTIDEQTKYIVQLGNGALASDGFQEEWSQQISVLEGEDLSSAIGVSSTAIRKAVGDEDWTTLGTLCTPKVAAWLKEDKPYD